ncbi:MAG: diversity-generating retroelement protein Avd [Anaerolineales bacterium]|nr:diversity-generating retroelement protein Avd [Anaerolineales bacterium]
MESKNDRAQSPIFTKTSDFILWLLQHTEKYPKSERFRLARKLEETTFEFYELLIQAACGDDLKGNLLQADIELTKLRLYLRLAHARKLASQSQYHFAAGSLREIGKLLGGWSKTIKEQT